MRNGKATETKGLRGLLAAPVLEGIDLDRARRARVLYRMLITAYPVLLILTVAAWFSGQTTARVTYPLQCAMVLLVLALIRKGKTTLATALMLLSVWGLSSITIFEEGGAGSAAMGSYALTVLMAGFFWDRRGAQWVSAIAIASAAVLIWAPERLGLPAFVRSDKVRYFAETTAQILVTGFLLHYALEFIRQAAAERHAAELAAAEAKLQAERGLRQAQKFQAIGRLAGGVAHDFKNLLTVIQAEAGLIREANPHVDVSAIEEASAKANRLATQLLAVGRQQDLKPRPFELNAMLRSSMPVLRSVSGPHARLELSLAESEFWVEADPEQFERVLVNLVKNASDAMRDGGVIRVRSQRDGDQVKVTVEDQGEGMTPETQARLFEPFFTTKGDAGTGLGLATAHGIVTQSGGRLIVDSNVGAGTRMHVILPPSLAH
ncbi:MAG TPA: ATP-binding protein [Polyangiaceae bacterium]|nr:ATP-binding protein [Polyangiaceae bacterium]